MALVETNNLQMHFYVKNFWGKKSHVVKAVDGVSFHIDNGETFGLVGESGCGKSTLGRTIIRMYEPTGGTVLFDGDDITNLKRDGLQPYHRRMQIIFQDPYSALDPYHNVGEIIREPMSLYMNEPKDVLDERIAQLLKKVGLKADDMHKYAYEFSGGQRQRIGIARAIAVRPEFILCDEPISALDVSIQAQVVNLLEDLQEEFGMSYLFVAHDLQMVRHISTRIGVMYLGKIVEIAGSDELYENPLHPYTKALLAAIPVADPKMAAKAVYSPIKGDIPSPLDVPKGCRFHTRCPYAGTECTVTEPEMTDYGNGHFAACHYKVDCV